MVSVHENDRGLVRRMLVNRPCTRPGCHARYVELLPIRYLWCAKCSSTQPFELTRDRQGHIIKARVFVDDAELARLEEVR